MSVFDFDHLTSGKFTYFSHFGFAMKLVCILLLCAFVSLFHAFFPFLFSNFVSMRLDALTKAIEDK
tara:strand:+ start:334 stop:531 length:198 start_codon:yes stop_codon:yes gene_type:complete